MYDDAIETPIFPAKSQARPVPVNRRQGFDMRRDTYVRRDPRTNDVNAFIAHEVKQPLAAIAANAATSLRWLTRADPNVPEAIEAVRRIAADVERASAIIQHIYALTANTKPQMSRVDLNGAIDEVIALAGNEAFNRRVSLNFERAADLPAVHGDAVQLQQVILNLVVNAMQAMATIDAPELVIRTVRSDPYTVLVEVKDAGAGTDCEDLERLFSPFYSTKSSGMGMGLALSRLIVEAHQGRIWAARNTDAGLTFQFTVPVSRE
jgi:signal transduction histidine kinase